jgi:SpoVK/Ycf46/Vps4 family AAA+-type ATPase
VPRRIVGELLGHSDMDEELVAFSMVRRSQVSLDQVVLPEATKSLVLSMVQNHPRFLARRREWGIDEVLTYGRGMVLLFVGRPGTGKTMLANAIAHELDKRLFCVDLSKLVNANRSFEANLDAVFREAKLLDAVIFFDECEQVFASRRFGNDKMPLLLTRLESFDGIAVLATNMAGVLDEALMRRTVACIEFKAPTPSERAEIWRRHLPAGLPLAPDADLQRIAEDFELTGGYIKNAVLTAIMRSTARDADSVSMEDLVHGARLQVRLPTDDAEGELRVVRPEARLEDVVLPSDVRRRVDGFIAAAKVRPTVLSEWGFGRTLGRGTGLAGLISGPPGTGKSMTAEAIATALERPLIRCLLTAVISKYVGDTAKNVASLFERAKAQHAVLLFEEADALFARRVEVRTANDRFANAESAALLTQMETHSGIVLLTTNLEVAIDPAFERRLQMRITLPAPDARARAAIWRKLLPAEAPLAPDVDPTDLGRRFDLSGGLIRNAVQAAALLAASAPAGQRIITRSMLERAAVEQAAQIQPPAQPAWAAGEA